MKEGGKPEIPSNAPTRFLENSGNGQNCFHVQFDLVKQYAGLGGLGLQAVSIHKVFPQIGTGPNKDRKSRDKLLT